MQVFDVVGNMHLHTTASDGVGTHDEVAAAAARAGLDFIIYTDHNTWVDGVSGWYRDAESGRSVLRLMGQEINDQNREPECNHLLCHFISSDLNGAAANPQKLIDAVAGRGGLTFLAHPIERPGFGAAEQTYPWVNWEVTDFTGIELWNAMSDVKWRLRSVPRGLLGAYLPNWVLYQPFPEMLAKWDELLAAGQKVVAIGGSDAHAWPITWKIFTHVIYPYEYLFKAVNTHVLLPEPLSQNVAEAQQQLYQALKLGHCYVSNDLVAAPNGLLFTGRCGWQTALMGDSLRLEGKAALRVASPLRGKIKLLRNGEVIASATGTSLEVEVAQPGVYRAEIYRWFWGATRGWVYTNPIYVEH